jgi:hypothetical protein
MSFFWVVFFGIIVWNLVAFLLRVTRGHSWPSDHGGWGGSGDSIDPGGSGSSGGWFGDSGGGGWGGGCDSGGGGGGGGGDGGGGSC